MCQKLRTDHVYVGELFLGQDFEGLLANKPPQFLHDMDNHFLLSGIESSFPWLYTILSRLPIPTTQHFFNSRPRLAQVRTVSHQNNL